MGSSERLEFESGHAFTVRKPTVDELCAYMGRRQLLRLGIRPSANIYDDGDSQILACIEEAAEAEKFLAEYPLATEHFIESIMRLAGQDRQFVRCDHLIPQEMAGKRLLAWSSPPSWTDDNDVLRDYLLVVGRFSRYDYKALDVSAKERKIIAPLPADLVSVVREKFVTKTEDLTRVKALLDAAPLLLPNIALAVFNEGRVKLRSVEKKF